MKQKKKKKNEENNKFSGLNPDQQLTKKEITERKVMHVFFLFLVQLSVCRNFILKY